MQQAMAELSPVSTNNNNEDTDDEEIEPLHGGLQIATNTSVLRQSYAIPQSSSTRITIQFSANGRCYDGWALFRLLNSRYLYTVTTTETGGFPCVEKAFLVPAKVFSEKKALQPYESTTLDRMKAVRRFFMMTVAMVKLSNGQVLTIVEGLDEDTGSILVVSLSILIARWSRSLVKRKVADLRKRQDQRNLIKAT
jgi:hypothetical protein